MRVKHSKDSLGVRDFLVKDDLIEFVASKTLYANKKGVYFLDHKNKRSFVKQIEPTKINGFLVEFVFKKTP